MNPILVVDKKDEDIPVQTSHFGYYELGGAPITKFARNPHGPPSPIVRKARTGTKRWEDVHNGESMEQAERQGQ